MARERKRGIENARRSKWREGEKGVRGRRGCAGTIKMYPMSRACGVATDRLKRRNESREDEGGEGYKRAEDVVWHVSL